MPNPIIRRRSGAANLSDLYLLYDDFSDTRPAGAINGTLPLVGGARTVTDTESKLSIAGGVLSFAGGKATPSSVDPLIKYAGVARSFGRVMIAKLYYSSYPSVALNSYFGFSTSPGVNGNLFGLRGTTALRAIFGSTVSMAVGNVSVATDYLTAIVLRLTGAFYFIRGGSEYPKWTLMWVDATVNTANPNPTFSNVDAVCTADNIRVPAALFIPAPLASDGFSGATTDGLGHAEANGGGGLTWTDRVGTVGRSGGKAIATATSGGIAISTFTAPTPNVLHTAAITKVTTGAGLILRYVDANNYIYIKRVATNIVVGKVIGGTDTPLTTTALTDVNGAELRGITSGTSLLTFYNNAVSGATQTIADAAIQNSGEMGVIFYDTDSTIDNLYTFARGIEGQWEGLSSL